LKFIGVVFGINPITTVEDIVPHKKVYMS